MMFISLVFPDFCTDRRCQNFSFHLIGKNAHGRILLTAQLFSWAFFRILICVLFCILAYINSKGHLHVSCDSCKMSMNY